MLNLGIGILVPPTTAGNYAYRNVSMYAWQANGGAGSIICNLDTRQWWVRDNGYDYVVSSRTVLFHVTSGKVSLIKER
jgi:hypothetical protein